MTLLNLAQIFDRTDLSDLETRLALAVQIKDLLGDRRDEFSERYERLPAACSTPAETVCREMGLDHLSTKPAIDVSLCIHRVRVGDETRTLCGVLTEGMQDQFDDRSRTIAKWVMDGVRESISDFACLVCRDNETELTRLLHVESPCERAADLYRRWMQISAYATYDDPALREAATAWFAARDAFVFGSSEWGQLQDLLRSIDAAVPAVPAPIGGLARLLQHQRPPAHSEIISIWYRPSDGMLAVARRDRKDPGGSVCTHTEAKDADGRLYTHAEDGGPLCPCGWRFAVVLSDWAHPTWQRGSMRICASYCLADKFNAGHLAPAFRAHLDACIDNILKRPGMYGSAESVIAQTLLLLQLRCWPQTDQGIAEAWRRREHEICPKKPGPLSLDGWLGTKEGAAWLAKKAPNVEAVDFVAQHLRAFVDEQRKR